MTRITFLGAAGTVTGSKLLVETAQARVLIDCGLFQGVKALRERNWAPPPLDPRSLDAVILTHAHIDHLLRILLPDSGPTEVGTAATVRRFGRRNDTR